MIIVLLVFRGDEKVMEHHSKKKSRKSKSPVTAKAHSPSPPPPKMDDIPKKHKMKEGKKKVKDKKRYVNCFKTKFIVFVHL